MSAEGGKEKEKKTYTTDNLTSKKSEAKDLLDEEKEKSLRNSSMKIA